MEEWGESRMDETKPLTTMLDENINNTPKSPKKIRIFMGEYEALMNLAGKNCYFYFYILFILL